MEEASEPELGMIDPVRGVNSSLTRRYPTRLWRHQVPKPMSTFGSRLPNIHIAPVFQARKVEQI